jgi:predicted AAA+ superfamily ATPase
LTAQELGDQFDLKKALKQGLLPMSYLNSREDEGYLAAYVGAYLREEVQQEGLVQNLGTFSRFLEIASFSQGQIINYSKVASESSIERKTVTNYFQILEDLLLAHSLDVFSIRAKRALIKKRKFYFFDCGVFRQIRPRGPLDSDSELNGAALETLVLQEILALNHYFDWEYKVAFWHTRQGQEVDFVLYGERGFKAIEVKASDRLRPDDFKGLLEFKKDYPKADATLLYGGAEEFSHNDIRILPLEKFFSRAAELL